MTDQEDVTFAARAVVARALRLQTLAHAYSEPGQGDEIMAEADALRTDLMALEILTIPEAD